MRRLPVLLLLATLAWAMATTASAQERQCGQNLNPGPDRAALAVLCAERDFNQALASCRTCQNVAFIGVLAGFTGLAHNVNGRNTDRYHTWQFVGQTSAGYLLYTNNTSRGGLLRFVGLLWVTNSVFQSFINKASGLCGDDGGLCWTSREEATWDLEGIPIPKGFYGSSRSIQFTAGIVLIGAGLTIDLWDYLDPKSGRHISAEPLPNGARFTYTF